MKTIQNKISKWFISGLATIALIAGCASSPALLHAQPRAGAAHSTTAPAAAEQFDGAKLYRAVFEALRDKHIELSDPAVRAKWVAQWENKHANDSALKTEKGADAACLEMVRSLNQRFDYYFEPRATAEEQDEEDPSFVGTGLAFGIKASKDKLISDTNPLLVLGVTENSPAFKADIHKFDRITAIDGKSVNGQTLKQVADQIKGKENTSVKLTLERGTDSSKQILTPIVVRAAYVKPVVHFTDLGNGISLITLDNFESKYAVREMFEALKKAAKGKAVIINLRGNPGGNLEFVQQIAQFFLEDGTILEQHERVGDATVTTRLALQPDFTLTSEESSAKPGQVHVNTDDRMLDLLPTSMPVIVLVDEDTWSASEILSGVLQKNHRATIVGMPTGGKGVGQTVVDLPFHRRMHVTSFQFLPGGAAMDWVGIVPDVEVKKSPNLKEGDLKTDAQLSAAIQAAQGLLDKQANLDKERDLLRKKNVDDFKKNGRN